jgi:hypothetical protein
MNNWQCNCGFDLKALVDDEQAFVATGQRRIHITCPVCETIYTFIVDWTPTVRPEPVAAIVQAK